VNSLVGYTGFVGSNIYAKGEIDKVYNSKNIKESFGTNPDLLIYAGLRAEKYLANTNAKQDMDTIIQAEENITAINPKKLVLISTIDVFKNPKGVNEDSEVDTSNLSPYGYNRYQLEKWTRLHYPDALIIRLPGLFGRNIKKNFIYDYINVIPYMLSESKYGELVIKDNSISKYYQKLDNGFYRFKAFEEKETVREVFDKLNFSALNFTDSRSSFQFYNLERLWQDIQIAINNDILLWHPATEPVTATEIYHYLTGKDFENRLDGSPADYNYKTKYAEKFGGHGDYICNKQQVLEDIKEFVSENMGK